MSLLIKDVNMPKCCDDCTFYQDDVFPACKFLWDDFNNYRHPVIERDKNCPLSEIPTPHGRLIDADALINDLQGLKKLFPSTGMDYIGGVISLVKNTPTIIEAEDIK